MHFFTVGKSPWFKTGVDIRFSRGGGGFFFIWKLLSTFCRPLGFPSSPKALQRLCFGKYFCAAGEIFKKQAKKAFSGTFWKVLTKKLGFFGARSPLELVYIGAEGAFKKIRVHRQKWISENSTKRGPFRLADGRIHKGMNLECQIFLKVNHRFWDEHTHHLSSENIPSSSMNCNYWLSIELSCTG